MSDNRSTPESATLVLIGASGFIGEHLLSALSCRENLALRVLIHRHQTKAQANVEFIEGDLLRPDSLDSLLVAGSTVINLAYLPQENLKAMTNLAQACVKNGVRRLIHCSTAVVVGRAGVDCVTENTPPVPTNEYERTKLLMEDVLLEISDGKFEICILRPSAVFGPKGRNLIKLAKALMQGSAFANYARSCLFGRRSMNLVCVENVVAAAIFLCDAVNVDREVFILSDDDASINNYRDIEDRLLQRFMKSYPVPRLSLPAFALDIMLRLAGKPNVRSSMKYSDRKLGEWGFEKPQSLEAGIDAFADWYRISGFPEA